MKTLLEASGIYDYFTPSLLLYSSVEGIRKDSPEIFKRAAHRAGLSETPGLCVFVGENAGERTFAQQAGFQVTDHPEKLERLLQRMKERMKDRASKQVSYTFRIRKITGSRSENQCINSRLTKR